MLAVCQPSVPCYAAAAVMSADKDPARPATLTMMGGPIDTREAPTEVNTVATQRPHRLVRAERDRRRCRFIIRARGRRVYPGFLQLTGFMAMNLGNHLNSHWAMFKHLVDGDGEGADQTKAFYDEYRSVCDMAAEFYLADDRRGVPAAPAAQGRADASRQAGRSGRDHRRRACSRSRASATIFPGIGQTKAALTIATALPDDKKKYYLAEAVGHYGIFNGRRWREIDRAGRGGVDRRA